MRTPFQSKRSNTWKWAIALGAGALLAFGVARGQQPPPPVQAQAVPAQPNVADLLRRLEELERSNAEMKQSNAEMKRKLEVLSANGVRPASAQAPIGNTPANPVPPADDIKKIVGDYLKEQEAAKKAKEAEDKENGVRVGSNLNLHAYIDNNGYPWLATPNNDFTIHWGAWFQYDNVFFQQGPGMNANPVARPTTLAYRTATESLSGPAAGGIGDLQDGTYFRRVRPFVEGTLWEDFEFRYNLVLDGIQFNTVGLDEVWIAWNNIPIIGTIRAGHVKNTIGFEGDMTASSRTMTFMERSSYSEAIENNQNFVSGVWFGNAFFDQRATYSAAVYREDIGSLTGVFFGDGQWGWSARATALPIYTDNGRQWLHLGLSSSWHNGANNTTGAASGPGSVATPDYLFQLRARPEIRGDDPAGGGGAAIANANSNRMIDTGAVIASDEWTLGTELCYVRGPLSFQAEYGWDFLQGVTGLAPVAGGGGIASPVPVPLSNYIFGGGYLQVAYTLTGESRGYDRARGILSRPYFIGGPFSPAFFNRNDQGGICKSLGAVEIAARYSYTNLNDGSGLTRINGGTMQGVTLGLNWYLNANMTLMFDYVHDYRYNVPGGFDGTPAVVTGSVDGFSSRVQLSF